jgi:hypothetical protein
VALAALLIPSARAEDVDIIAILTQVDDAMRGEASSSTITMEVKTKRFERSMSMQSWSQGTERSLIRLLSPAKDAGVATLKVDKNLWNYLPNTDRTMKVPGAMMSGAWMGSHLSNDDLVRETRFSEDYACTLAAQDEASLSIACTPNPDAPVVWGRVDVKATPAGVPIEQVFYDEDGEKIRTLGFSDVETIGARQVPMTMLVTPHDKPGEFTKLTFSDMVFDPEIPAGLFTLQSLKR